MLILLSGLPATGKTTIARLLARRRGAVHLRLDTIEAALLRAGLPAPLGPEGYHVAYALALDHLRQGFDVVADAVNSLAVVRDAWHATAAAAPAEVLDVEVVCSDTALHRRRVDERVNDLAGMAQPTWAEITTRTVEPWPNSVLRVDTGTTGADEAAAAIDAAANLRGPRPAP